MCLSLRGVKWRELKDLSKEKKIIINIIKADIPKPNKLKEGIKS